MNNRFGKLVQTFLTNYIIGECNYSINTKESYSTVFYLLIEFLNEVYKIESNKIEIEMINKEIIIQFLNWLEENRSSSILTRNQRLSCIKSFYKYIQRNEPDLFETSSKILDIHYKKVSDKIISHFTEKETKIMINFLNKCKDIKKLVLICVIYETGGRVSEIINIKLSDLNLSENASITLYGKRNKIRNVPISQELVKVITKYLNEEYIDYGDNYLFYSNFKRKYSRSSINKKIDKLILDLKKENPKYFKEKYSPHSFRHTKATHLCNNGTPLIYVKDFLGHSTISSTEIYITADIKKEREELLKNSETIKTNIKYSNSKKENLENWLKINMKH